MTSIIEVAQYLPSHRIPVAEQTAALAVDSDAYQRYYGFGHVRRDADANLAEQLRAAGAALRWLPGREDQVRYVVHAPTIQLTAPYPINPVATASQALGLRHALPFSLTQHACASALLAIDVCGTLLATEDPDAVALVFTGEKTFTRVARVIDHSAVMGEGVAAVLVRAHGDSDRVLAYATRILGQFHEAPELTPELDAEFQQMYADTLAEVIQAALKQADLAVTDVALVLPHNVNRLSWLRVMRRAGIPMDRLYLDNQAELGHCFGADPFIAYRSARAGGRLRRGDHYLMVAAGLGATLAAMVFRH
ncbi:3-oxoacyl-[acyl-carrier-protein] synthase III C-terminal domain-containing protein [Solwaraspora sp. WMMD406]|uniref:3-oxoacyl-[acyl-carrier-protein] synthase III C-terminal domain-containing protein n=1 Tax=Solwaraspora sp. WMMD406 TaxID=3016095 RepID=UPI0024165389|nr:3-oxoacyl-[acyl-carrier-protein] synthase III C-terminal domain-containing protein [Solwaraspora sp. WMMD406]MDG4766908.1 3-oxoacyl-[acyl-carrier-protein] synthase III C-terminal domain-containing protein [Solwaraspora sp. WMMD406]